MNYPKDAGWCPILAIMLLLSVAANLYMLFHWGPK